MLKVKRFYWLKLKEDFFDEKYIKALRKLPQGDSLVIVYLKMQLKSLKTEGIIRYDSIFPDSISELALSLDEDENVVRMAVEALIKFGVVERWNDETLYIAAMQPLIGSESESAERVRRHRAIKQNCNALPCNGDVTDCNTEIENKIIREQEIDTDQNPEKQDSTLSTELSTSNKPVRHKCGQYNNVFLSDDDMEKLKKEFPLDWSERIERLSEYIESKGVKYKNHLATIRTWARKDQQKQPHQMTQEQYGNAHHQQAVSMGMTDEELLEFKKRLRE